MRRIHRERNRKCYVNLHLHWYKGHHEIHAEGCPSMPKRKGGKRFVGTIASSKRERRDKAGEILEMACKSGSYKCQPHCRVDFCNRKADPINQL